MRTSARGDVRMRLLAARPSRASDVQLHECGDGAWRLKAPVRASRFAAWIMRLPASSSRTFELDEIGKHVWDACDSEQTVQAIIENVASAYRLNRREAEVSTLAFLQTLSRKGLIRWGTRD